MGWIGPRRKNGCWRVDGWNKEGRTSLELKEVFVDLKNNFHICNCVNDNQMQQSKNDLVNSARALMQRVPIETRFLAATEGTFCTRIFQPNERCDEYWRKFVNLFIHSPVREKIAVLLDFVQISSPPPPSP